MNDGVYFVQDLAVILLAATIGGVVARKLGMSSVVGYLFAGLLVGTPQVTFVGVTDEGRVQVLSQVGLVFLMFSIGLGIPLRNLKALGFAPILATVLTAVLIFTLTRLFGGLVGLDSTESIFLAAMLMVSSSAIIGKILGEMGLLHQRAGQLAMTQTLLEDFVAIAMLTFLGSMVAYGQAGNGGWSVVLGNLGRLGAFVLLFVIAGLLILPRVVRRLSRDQGEELQTILITGILFALALLAVLAGYSLALGAFLCGVLVAEIPRASSIERSFSGMRDVFTAVFFVAIGMGIDLTQAPSAAGLIVLGTVLALVGRVLSASIAWMVVGEDEMGAIRAALFLTPIGEFSFIIAGLGVSSGVLHEGFGIAAVGIAFLTSLIAPLGMRHSESIAKMVTPRRSSTFRDFFDAYRELWGTIGKRGGSHLLWRLLRPRLFQIMREILWISATLLLARPVYTYLEGRLLAEDAPWNLMLPFLPWYWLGILLLVLAPLVALLRNLNALCMILADYAGQQSILFRNVASLNLGFLRVVVFGITGIWLLNLLPWALIDIRILGAVGVIALLIMALSWRHLVRWHRQAEEELREVFASLPSHSSARHLHEEWDAAREQWGLHLEETRLPDHFAGAGRSIAELRLRERTGVTVVGVERQGWALNQPGPQTHLFPGDEVLLLGSNEEIAAALAILGEEEALDMQDNQMHRAILEPARVPAGSPLLGRRLSQLNWPRLHGVQVAAARREGREMANPGPAWALAEGDELLLIGSHAALRTVRRSLEPPEPVSDESPPSGEAEGNRPDLP